jgi:hypothetical protein
MNTAGMMWMILFYFFTALFFVIAFVVIWRGFADLRDLLAKTDKTGNRRN